MKVIYESVQASSSTAARPTAMLTPPLMVGGACHETTSTSSAIPKKPMVNLDTAADTGARVTVKTDSLYIGKEHQVNNR